MLGITLLSPGFLFSILVFALITTSFWLGVYGMKIRFVHKKIKNNSFFPKLSIIIPVHNGAKDIGKTLKSVFRSKYPKKNIEVITINDASSDNTLSILKQFPVKIINNAKQLGKVGSLNKAIKQAKGDIIVTMDDDSLLSLNSLALIVKPFEDIDIGAVAGVYRTRGESKLIEKLQTLEYMWFSFTRKLQEALGCVLVIPGALGAFRKNVLIEAGGFDSDTMIEDYDMTVKIHKKGYKVACVKDAYATIKAPSTIFGLMKQRTRWYRGGFQVFWKHRDVFSGRRGMLSFLWVFESIGLALQLFVIGYLGIETIKFIITTSFAMFLSLIRIWFADLMAFNLNYLGMLPIFIIVLFALGLVGTFASLRLSGAPIRKLSVYPLTMFYATFMTFVIIKSLFEEIFRFDRVWSSQHGNC